MKRSLLALGCCAVLASCGGHAAKVTPGGGGPGSPSPQLSADLNQQLPAVPGLDALRSTSAITFSGLTMVANFNASINGGGELILDGTPNHYAWAVFDLGVEPVDFSIGSVNFPHAPDWSSIVPLPNAFVGCSLYSLNHWVFRQRKANGTAADFNGLPPASAFLSGTGHSYLAILADSTSLSFGDQLSLTGTAGPGGELPAKYTVDFPGLPATAGLNNQLIVKPDFSGGDIATYSPGSSGGSIVRFTYDTGTDTISPTVIPLFDTAQMLQGCYSYRLDYYADGRLAIGAAKKAPNTIRAIKEDSAGAGTFAFDAASPAADNTILPTSFDDPQFDYKVNTAGNYQCLFLANTGKLAYSYEVAGSNGIDSGGPDILGAINMRLIGNTDLVCAYRSTSGLHQALTVSKFQQRPAGNDFGTPNNVFADPQDDGAQSVSLALGLGNSIQVAQTIHRTVGNVDNLGFTYSADGNVGGSWSNTTADDGAAVTDSLGETPSLGILRDGTPVIAYYDTTNQSLRFAISTAPAGGNVTGGTWTTFRIDTSRFGNQVGLNPALGVIQRTGADPDKVVVAYGVGDVGTNVMRVILFDAPAH